MFEAKLLGYKYPLKKFIFCIFISDAPIDINAVFYNQPLESTNWSGITHHR
jgi:hypothetical protein